MNWTKIAEFPLDAQLHHLHQYLASHQVTHRFTEETGLQILWLADPAHVTYVNQYFTILEQGGEPQMAAQTSRRRIQLQPRQMLRLFPLTIIILLLGIGGYLITTFWIQDVVDYLSFLPVTSALATGQVWRVLSPAFLHFGLLHILFNGLWIWELGRRIEVFAGRRSYFITFLIAAIAANYLQFAFTSGTLFGGLSGVVYAFLGYLLVWGRYSKNPLVQLPPGIYVFMLTWLALGFVGIIDKFIAGQVANGAHLGGLLSGIAVAAAEVADSRKKAAKGQ